MKKHIAKIICLLLWLIVLSNHCIAQATATINGVVADDKGPLPGATVFLSNTSLITPTSADGTFKLTRVPAGNYTLVVKMLGFEPFTKQISLDEHGAAFSIVLKDNITKLQDVVIRPDKQWFNNYSIFKKQFIGENANAGQCKILNAEVLTFKVDSITHKLNAKSDELLKIENKALGYKLTYLLTGFEYDLKKNTLVYRGYPSFENMKGTADQEADWAEARKKAYEGSIQHFIRSLYNNTVTEQGYLVFEMNKWTIGGSGYHITNDPVYRNNAIKTDTLLKDAGNGQKILSFGRPLFVVYQKHLEDISYQAAGYSLSQLFNDQRLPGSQSSIISLLSDAVVIDNKGAFYRTDGLFFEGYMGWQKVANLMPFGFEPADK